MTLQCVNLKNYEGGRWKNTQKVQIKSWDFTL